MSRSSSHATATAQPGEVRACTPAFPVALIVLSILTLACLMVSTDKSLTSLLLWPGLLLAAMAIGGRRLGTAIVLSVVVGLPAAMAVVALAAAMWS